MPPTTYRQSGPTPSKQWRAVALVAIMVFSAITIVGVGPAAALPVLTLDSVDATQGSTVTVPLSTNASNVAGYQANVTFDPAVVQVQSVSAGEDFASPLPNINNEDGWVKFTASQATGENQPELALVTFEIVGSPGTATDLSFVGTTGLSDNQGQSIEFTPVAGNITVIGPSVEEYSVADTTLHPGQATSVEAVVENPTNVESSVDVTLFTDGTAAQTETVTVPAGGTETVSFSASFATVGDHELTVADLPPTQITVAESDLILEEVDAQPDSTVTVQLYMEDATNIAGYSTNFTFDPSVVQVESIDGVDFNDPVPNINNEQGWAFITQSAATGQDNPVFAEITFQVVGAGGNATDLTFVPEQTSVNNAQGSDVSLFLHDGNVTVQACEPGDANGDGSVSPSDATIVQREVVGLPISGPFNPGCADIAPFPGGDGDITPADVTLIQRKIVGLPPFDTGSEDEAEG